MYYCLKYYVILRYALINKEVLFKQTTVTNMLHIEVSFQTLDSLSITYSMDKARRAALAAFLCMLKVVKDHDSGVTRLFWA